MYIENSIKKFELRDPWERDFSFTMGQFPLRRRLNHSRLDKVSVFCSNISVVDECPQSLGASFHDQAYTYFNPAPLSLPLLVFYPPPDRPRFRGFHTEPEYRFQ